MSILTIDVGNTRLKWSIFDAPRPNAPVLAQGACLLSEIDELADGEWAGTELNPTQMLGCIVAGEAVRRRTEEQLVARWSIRPRWILPTEQQCGVTNGYDFPGRLGADRWAALIGARHLLPDRAVLVVMVGTCVVIDALGANGTFLGGVILPGFGLMLQALEMGTAGLKVPSGEICRFPTNTSDALMSGGANAIAGAIERMHRELARHEQHAPLALIAGGAAPKLLPIIELPYRHTESLIFQGLLCMADERQPTRPTLLPATR